MAWLLAAGPVAWAVFRLAGLDRGDPFVAFVSFTPHVLVVCAGVVLVLIALRRWRPLALAATATLVLAAVVVPRAVGGSEAGPGPRLRVLTVNAAVGGVPAEAIAAIVRERRVDILSVQELTPDLDEDLRAGDGVLPHAVTAPEEGATGTGLFARFALEELPPPRGSVFAQVAARTRGFEIVAVHPPPPIGSQHVAQWHQTLRGLPDGDRPRMLLGDFNATLDHRALRRLIGTGYTDAADATGEGLTATYPANQRWRPRIAIDHVLVTGDFIPTRVEVLWLPSGDHRAVYAELACSGQNRFCPGD